MMEEITLNKPTGPETYKVICSFRDEESGYSYVVLDSNRKDANQNTITYIYRMNGNDFEYIEDDEWNKVKQNLISIVKGEANYD